MVEFDTYVDEEQFGARLVERAISDEGELGGFLLERFLVVAIAEFGSQGTAEAVKSH